MGLHIKNVGMVKWVVGVQELKVEKEIVTYVINNGEKSQNKLFLHLSELERVLKDAGVDLDFLKSRQKLLTFPKKVFAGYYCGHCKKEYSGSPIIKQEFFDAPSQHYDDYGETHYRCEHCKGELGEAEIRGDEFYNRLAEAIHKHGGLP